MITYYQSDNNTGIKKTEGAQATWIFAYDLTPDEFSTLTTLGFDELLLEDAGDYFEVPRYELVDDTHYLFTRYAVNRKDGELSTAPLLFAVKGNQILTLSHAKPEFLDNFAHGRSYLDITHSTRALLRMLDVMVSEYQRSLMKIRRRALRYFSEIETISEKDIKNIVATESRLADYGGALSPMGVALSIITRRKKAFVLNDELEIMLDDLIQDIHQIADSTRSVSKSIQNIRSAHSSILAHKLNTTMKTLTVVTIVLTVPTIVTSLFGMNTWLPFSSGPVSFMVVLGIIFIASYAVAKWFSKKKIL